MVDSRNRELMAELYRMMERYERPPIIDENDIKRVYQYLNDILDEIASIVVRYPGNEFASQLTLGLYEAIDKRLGKVNPWMNGGAGNDH